MVTKVNPESVMVNLLIHQPFGGDMEYANISLAHAGALVKLHPEWKSVTCTLVDPTSSLDKFSKTTKDSSLAMAGLGELLKNNMAAEPTTLWLSPKQATLMDGIPMWEAKYDDDFKLCEMWDEVIVKEDKKLGKTTGSEKAKKEVYAKAYKAKAEAFMGKEAGITLDDALGLNDPPAKQWLKDKIKAKMTPTDADVVTPGKAAAKKQAEDLFELFTEFDKAKSSPEAASSAVLLPEDSEMIYNTKRLSYSSLDLYDRCQYSWLGQYVIGVPDVPNAGLVFGSVVHAALEYANNVHIETGEVPHPDDVGARFALLWSSAVPDEMPSGPLTAALDDFWQGLLFEDLLQAGTILVRSYIKEFAPKYLPIEAEQQYEIDLRKTYPLLDLKHIERFVGRMDMVSLGDVVIDYKTRASPGNPAWMHLALQPTSYAALLAKPITMHFVELIRGSKKTEVRLFETARLQEDIDWFLGRYLPNKAKEIDNKLVALAEFFPISDIPQLLVTDPEGVQRMIHKMAQIFPPSPSWNCDFCAFRIPCGYHLPAGV